MTVAQYASKNKVSKQSVYDRLRRGTLSARLINGVKHIIEPDLETVKPDVDSSLAPDKKKLLVEVLKRLNKARQVIRLLKQRIESDIVLIKSLRSEIDTLKKSHNTLSLIVDSQIIKQLPQITDADIIPEKKTH